MTTTKKGQVTIKNFADNKSAMVNYFNNIRTKNYVEMVCCGFLVPEKGWCVKIVYKKK